MRLVAAAVGISLAALLYVPAPLGQAATSAPATVSAPAQNCPSAGMWGVKTKHLSCSRAQALYRSYYIIDPSKRVAHVFGFRCVRHWQYDGHDVRCSKGRSSAKWYVGG